jgi:hypothetical protein
VLLCPIIDDDLERAWGLPSDATPLQRLLAFRPKTGPGWQHWHYLVRRLCREQGLSLPWADPPGAGNPTTTS